MNGESSRRTIGVVSGKGGVGKTVATINLGLALLEMGKDVTVVDADMTASNLGIQLGFYPLQPFTLQNVLSRRVPLQNTIYLHPSGLRIIPSAVAVEKPVKSERIKDVLNRLRGLVLVDSPAGLDAEALAVLRACDDVLVITNPEYPAVTDAVKVIKRAKEYGKNVLGIVVNRHAGKKHELKPTEIEIMSETPVIGIIREDRNVKKSVFAKTPVLHHKPGCKVSRDFRRLAHTVTGMEYREPGFFSRLFRKKNMRKRAEIKSLVEHLNV
jgi:cell division ATPase MinD